MNLKLCFMSANILVFSLTLPCFAGDDFKACDQTNNMTFVTNDIFDLEDKDAIFLHSWANFLHIKTQRKTLLNESAFFINKCQFNEQDIAELERYLRSKKYIREALVIRDENNKVKVETWDNWSLLPTMDFGRKGGKNKVAFGIKERNLFGLGIDTEIEYFKNDQRTGYKFDTSFPLFLGNNFNASIRLTNNDDGSSESVFLQKEFVSFDTKNAYTLGVDNFDQIDTQYENGMASNRYQHKKNFSTVNWQWLSGHSANELFRYGVGYTQEKHSFLNTQSDIALETNSLPNDREFNYPFISIEYLQKDYRKLTNLNLINQIEDFNLGWNFQANLGHDFSSNDSAPTLIWQSQISTGFELFENSFLLFNAEFVGETYSNSTHDNRSLLKLETEYFHKFNENWGAYFKNANQFSKNQFLDSPIVLGGETGIRGYPLQYQHGNSSSQFTFEARYYPHINIYKLLELGGAAFVDTGRVYRQSEQSNQQSPWMTSIGLGARLYSTHSSEARVIHVDIIKPVTSDSNVNSVEIRITTKHSF